METLNAGAATTRDGRAWQPAYLVEIDAETCIGCGRCFKSCGRAVMTLMGINEDGEVVSLDSDDEIERKIMTLTDAGNCIGCGACGRACAKNCQKYAAN
jgi:Nif-specific ferredoxin III